MHQQVITIFGATGLQGGSVIKTFLGDRKLSGWLIRGVTRNASSEKARDLAAKGVEVVEANLNDRVSVLKAVQGSTVVYGVTNYWESLDKNLEVQQGKNIADAVKEAQVQHYIWSSLPNITKRKHNAIGHFARAYSHGFAVSGGVLSRVYHFDSKAEVESYVRSLNIPASFFMPGLYASNLTTNLIKKTPLEDGWRFFLPAPSTAEIPFFDVNGTGKFVKGMILNREQVLGKQILGASNYMTPAEAIETFKSLFPKAGENVAFVEMTHDAYRGVLTSQGLPAFAAEELLQNLRLLAEFGYHGRAKLDESHAILDDELMTWTQFARCAKEFEGLE
ncbi:NmrA-like domain-containing protein 1 [Verticillium nonalfalfae]|uniref:NmrA-like domain-containing protein 1 n=1 Tax=Verticillium nonalfalfae TaxID=1051616 RepID=A0A3M9YC96_9PEZI|nr:NmrA-like domain-containing protein 1 [Verticillium nonalfalfae]RNJ58079.1 NmrA-like domain-containing protein 1 [Verticillium nonalfalfae]